MQVERAYVATDQLTQLQGALEVIIKEAEGLPTDVHDVHAALTLGVV